MSRTPGDSRLLLSTRARGRPCPTRLRQAQPERWGGVLWLRQAQPERLEGGAQASTGSARTGGNSPHASTSSARTASVERSDDPYGCLWPHPLRAAPAPGRLRGGSRAGARLLRDLTRRGCPSGARKRKASSAAHPATATAQVCPFAARRGRRLGVAFLLGTFLWRSKEKYLARRGDIPAPGLNSGTRWPLSNQASTGSARTGRGETGFDRLSLNGW